MGMPVVQSDDGFMSQVEPTGDVSMAELHIALRRAIEAESPHLYVDLRGARVEKSGIALDIFIEFLWEKVLPELDQRRGKLMWLVNQSDSHPIIAELKQIAAELVFLKVITDPKAVFQVFAKHEATMPVRETDEILLTELAVA